MFEQIVELGAIHIRNKMHLNLCICPFIKRGSRHQWPKIRTADADINHIGHGFT